MTPRHHLDAAVAQIKSMPNDDELAPKLVVERAGRIIAIASPIGPAEVNRCASTMLVAYAGDQVTYVTDAYVYKADHDEVADLTMSPSDLFLVGNARATEAVVVQSMNATSGAFLQAAYVRSADGITVTEIHDWSGDGPSSITGRMAFDQDEITEAIAKGARLRAEVARAAPVYGVPPEDITERTDLAMGTELARMFDATILYMPGDD